jgi:LysR family transcriptional regulator, nitrogen assimilation regulatory protein
LIDWLAAGDLDLAIVNSARRKAGLSTHPLIDEELLLLQRDSGRRDLRPIPFKRLQELALVLPSRRHGMRNIVDEAAEKMGIQITPQIEVDALAPTLKLVSDSNLATVLPAIVARRAVAELPLRTRRIVEPALRRQLVYVYRAQRPLSLVLSAFIDRSQPGAETGIDGHERADAGHCR